MTAKWLHTLRECSFYRMEKLLRKSRGFTLQRRSLRALTVVARFNPVTKDARVAGKDYEQ
jgi:hypothetical protein